MTIILALICIAAWIGGIITTTAAWHCALGGDNTKIDPKFVVVMTFTWPAMLGFLLVVVIISNTDKLLILLGNLVTFLLIPVEWVLMRTIAPAAEYLVRKFCRNQPPHFSPRAKALIEVIVKDDEENNR